MLDDIGATFLKKGFAKVHVFTKSALLQHYDFKELVDEQRFGCSVGHYCGVGIGVEVRAHKNNSLRDKSGGLCWIICLKTKKCGRLCSNN